MERLIDSRTIAALLGLIGAGVTAYQGQELVAAITALIAVAWIASEAYIRAVGAQNTNVDEVRDLLLELLDAIREGASNGKRNTQ